MFTKKMRVVIAMYDVLLHTLSIITPTPAVVIVNTTDQYNRSLYWLHIQLLQRQI